jgi:hypothetical protein
MAIVVVLLMNICVQDIKPISAFLTSCNRFVWLLHFVL